jgi:AraC family transcriptional regulator, transcriptional activator of pobA
MQIHLKVKELYIGHELQLFLEFLAMDEERQEVPGMHSGAPLLAEDTLTTGSERDPATPTFRLTLQRLEICSAGRQDPASQSAHCLDLYQIIWVTTGAGVHLIDGEVYPVSDGTMFFVAPGQMHSWDTEAMRNHLRGYVIRFDADFVNVSILTERTAPWFARLYRPMATPVLSLEANQSKVLLDIVAKLEEEYCSQARGRLGALQAYFQVLLIQLDRFRSGSRPHDAPAPSALADKFRSLVDRHLGQGLCTADYARRLQVTESRLSDVIKRVTGMTPRQLLQERILLEAKRLLTQTEAGVSDIASGLGFDDPAYFCRFFRKGTNRSPTEFRGAWLEALGGRCARRRGWEDGRKSPNDVAVSS